MPNPTSNTERQSGTARILQLRPYVERSTFELYQAGEATYEKYAARYILQLWQAVLLHSGVDVDRLGYDGFQALRCRWGRNPRHLRIAIDTLVAGRSGHDLALEERLCLNVDRAVSAVLRGELEPELGTCILHTHTTMVDVEAFEVWSVKAGLPILGPWPEFANRKGQPIGAAVCFPGRTRWLETLSVLARELHGKPWPGKDRVVQRGVALGFSEHLAEVAAIILRPADAKSGRPSARSDP